MLIIQFVKLNHVDYMNYLVPIMTSIAIISSTLNYIINPGIIYSSNKVKEKVHCASCKMLYPKMSNNIVHCGICEICINGYDHHCGVIGKCVGKFNMVMPGMILINVIALVWSSFSIRSMAGHRHSMMESRIRKNMSMQDRDFGADCMNICFGILPRWI